MVSFLRGAGGGHLLVSCVPMRELKKTARKGTLFELDSAQRCHL